MRQLRYQLTKQPASALDARNADDGVAHTPAPWIANGDLEGVHPNYQENRYITTADFDEDTNTGSIIGVLRGHGPTLRANARLIAAAPELLAAAIEMQALIENLMKAVPWGKTFDLDIAALNTAPIHLAAAIAKAKGGAQ